MWRKARRFLALALLGLLLLAFAGSFAFNAFTQWGNQGPREAGVPGQFVAAGGGLTHYEAAGAGKVPVVLLHGFGMWSFTWRPTLSALGADGRFAAYAPDMKGFGFTERTPDSLYNVDGYARHIEEFIDALKLDRPILVGNSLGGAVALRVALDRPDRIRGLVLVDPATDNVPNWATGLARAAFIPPFNRTLIRAVWTRPSVMRSAVARLYADPKTVNLDEEVASLRKPLDQQGAEDALIGMLRTSSPPLPDDGLRALRIATLIVWGDTDRVVDVSKAGPLHDRLFGSRLVVYPHTGHLPHEEQRERFAADLIAFCGELVPRT
jgi:pimeloyl-ACP methyl ester carboxylesterase